MRTAWTTRTARMIAVCGLIGLVTGFHRSIGLTNPTTVALSLLLVVLTMATLWGLAESLTASVVATLCFNYFFLPPVGTLTIADPENWVALFTFLIVAVVASQLSERARRKTREAIAHQQETARLAELARQAELVRKSEEFKSTLVDALAHDLKTPLTSLKAAVSALRTDSARLPSEQQELKSARANEFQVQQLGVGGDFHYKNVRGRLMTQFGMYSQMTPRNDASPARGQWNLDNAYRYLSEAYGGYHFDKWHGINVDAGIFMSYVGLFSYYQFDNWAYQPSYVSSNTPWFFTGVRVQIFPTDKLKIEPWLINGWQSYGTFNEAPGLGLQVLWRPNGSVSILTNTYWGKDTLGNPGRKRFHSDNSVVVKYYDHPERILDKAAFSFTFDLGCESGGGVSCTGGTSGSPSQYFLGFMAYNRLWFHKDLFGLTIGGGAIQSRPLSRAHPADQRRDCVFRHALLHRQPRRPVPCLGCLLHV